MTRQFIRSLLRTEVIIGICLSTTIFRAGVSASDVPYVHLPYTHELPILPPSIPESNSGSLLGRHEFSLRHIFHRGTHKYPHLHRKLDIGPDTHLWVISEDTGIPEPVVELPVPFVTLSNPVTIQRLADRRPSVIESYLSIAKSTGLAVILSPSEWVVENLEGPNITDKQTVLTLARMTSNDYIEEPGSGDWEDIHGSFNYSLGFGWQSDGLRGHIYANEGNSTIIVSMKGTSPALFDGAGTTTNDKVNDNLYFSCCCGQGGSYLWRQACDCYKSTYTGNLTCIVDAMLDENRYYRAAIDLYTNVTALYPESNVWLTGHSLGGSMTSLLGLTFGLPTVTFQSIPDALPAARLGLPPPPGYDSRLPQTRKNTGSYHFGHTADPIYMGTCNGATSVCTWGGYALESACHTGQRCVYDTVGDKGWRVGIGTHRIKSVISDVIEEYTQAPSCAPEKECYDCELWKFFKSNDSEITSSSTKTSTSSSTRTRTSTCKTPGWWGCRDEVTTTTTATSITSSTGLSVHPTSATTATSTCKTPGWWGCRDEVITTTTTTSITSSAHPTSATTTTSTCKTPGWFGCRDKPTTSTVGEIPKVLKTYVMRIR